MATQINLRLLKPRRTTNLEFALAGEDADPLVVIVGNNDVTAGMHGHTCGALQLPWRPPAYPKPILEFPVVGEDLERRGLCEDPHRGVSTRTYVTLQSASTM